MPVQEMVDIYRSLDVGSMNALNQFLVRVPHFRSGFDATNKYNDGVRDTGD